MGYAISAIMPIYNAERYLARAINSLLQQTITNIEFLLIDDGSTDNSLAIAEEYALQDERIRVISQENQGVSIARNTGLANAIGEYIAFLDADDLLEPNMYEVLYQTAKSSEADVVICDYQIQKPDLKLVKNWSYPFPSKSPLDRKSIEKHILAYMIKSDGLGAPWNKLYKRLMLVENEILFPSGIPLGEDYLYNMEVFTYAERVSYLPQALYHYILYPASAVKKYREDRFQIFKQIDNLKAEYMKKWQLVNEDYQLERFKYFIAQAIASIEQEFKSANKADFLRRWQKIGSITNDPKVTAIIAKYGNRVKPPGIRCRLLFPWLKQRMVILLILGVILINSTKLFKLKTI